MTNLVKIKEEINTQLADKKTFESLLVTTFKGLEAPNVKRALMEGMMRGFEFKDFLEKNVYAVPFGSGYSLITSVDYARKIGMRSGIVGKSEPKFKEKDGKVIACTITVKKKVGDYIGDYSAEVFFDEYTTKKNLWNTKPRTMIAKVAEMHALRMACPEELSQSYIEEEFTQEKKQVRAIDLDQHKKDLDVDSLDELKKVWSALPQEAKDNLKKDKDEIKKALMEEEELAKKYPKKEVKKNENKKV